MTRRFASDRLASAGLTVVTVIFFVFLLAPILVVVVVSFSSLGYIGFPIPSYSLQWYRRLLEYQPFLDGLWVSIQLATVSTLLACLLGVPAALALARRTAAAAPQDAQAQLVLTELLRDNELWDEAVQVLDRLIAQSGPKADWRLYYLRGASQERGGRWDAAQADLQRALSLKPDEPEILNYLGYAWADRGERLPEALAMLQKATELQPNSGAIVDSLGWARYRLRDYPAAVTALEKAASLDPSDPEVNLHLGDAYWSTGRRLEAQFQWKRVLTLEPDARVRGLVEARLTGGGPTPAPAPTAQR